MENATHLLTARKTPVPLKKNLIRFLIKVLLISTLICIGFVFWKIDLERLKHYTTSSLTSTLIMTIMSLFILNFLIVSSRLKLAYQQFGYNINYITAVKTVFMGQAGGMIPVIGTMLGQGIYINSLSNISPSVSSVIVLYERIIMTITGLTLSLLIIGIFFKEQLSNFWNTQEFLFFLLLIKGLSLLIVFSSRSTRKLLAEYQSICSRRNFHYFIGLSILSCMSWLCSSAMFTFALKSLGSNLDIKTLFSGSLVVSFIASLPLSVNGWGLREFAAVNVFGYIGIVKEKALIAAMSVGALSFVALIVLGIVFTFGFKKQRLVNLKNNLMQSHEIEKTIVSFLGFSLCVLIFYQIHLQYNEIVFNINLADPLALCGFVITILGTLSKKLHLKFTIEKTKLCILFFVLAFIFSTIVGLSKSGAFNYYYFHKSIGFFILLGYAGSGAMLVHYFGKDRIKLSSQMMWYTICVIMLFNFLSNILVYIHVLPPELMTNGFVGFAGNRNAFCIQLLIILSLLISDFNDKKNGILSKHNWSISFILFGISLTCSRSGISVAIILLLLFGILKIINMKNILIFAIQTGLLLVGIWLLEELFKIGVGFYIAHFETANANSYIASLSSQVLFQGHYSGTLSNHERWYTMVQAIKHWLQSPVLGIGLGSFAYNEVVAGNSILVIHNTFLWLLTEFGLLGITPFVFYGLQIVAFFKKVLFSFTNGLSVQIKILLCLTIIGILMGMVHEIFYQRILWLTWGMAIVIPFARSEDKIPDELEANPSIA